MGFFLHWQLINRPPHLQTTEINWYKEGAYPWMTSLPQKQYLEITFTGNIATDRIKMDFGHLYLKDLMSTGDTVHGLSFHFGEHCPYRLFVEAVDLCKVEDVRTYAASDEGLFIFNISPSEIKAIRKLEEADVKNRQPTIHCGTGRN